MSQKPTYEDLERRIAALEEALAEAMRGQAALRESERKLRSLFDNAVEGVYQQREHNLLQAVMDGAGNSHLVYLDRDFNFVRVNETYAAACGYKPAEMVGKNHFALYPHSENEAIFARVRDTGEAFEVHDKPFEFPDQPERGVTYWDWTLKAVKDPAGLVIGLVLSLYETTVRKKAEEALLRARDVLELRVKARTKELRRSEAISRRQLIEIEMYYDMAPIGLCTLDRQLRYLRINKQLADFNGIPVSAHMGRTLRDVIPVGGEQREAIARQVLKSGVPVTNVELTIQTIGHPDVTRTSRSSWFPIKDIDGKVIGVGAMVEDITNQLRLEDQLRQSQKMEAIGTLAGGIAHDFNNILAGIIGFSEMVEEELPRNSPLVRYVKRVLQASFRGRDLVKQILAFSRRTEQVREPISLSPIIDETWKLLRASIPATIEMVLDIKAATDKVRASAAEVQQIVMNLATNAARSMSEKGGTLTISLSDIDFEPDSPVIDPEVEPGEYLQLVVQDTGIGMKPDIMKRIFEPFFTTGRVGEGTGMGLAVVYGIVKSLQGTVSVESKPGLGSTFRVFLPKVSTGIESQNQVPDEIPRGTERVLFVDDEELLVELGRDILENLGYKVTALTDSSEALKLFLSDPDAFDIVITDQTMPKISGLHLAKQFLEVRDDIPVVLCTGHSDVISSGIANSAGIRLFLMKPLSKRELAKAIRSVLDATD